MSFPKMTREGAEELCKKMNGLYDSSFAFFKEEKMKPSLGEERARSLLEENIDLKRRLVSVFTRGLMRETLMVEENERLREALMDDIISEALIRSREDAKNKPN